MFKYQSVSVPNRYTLVLFITGLCLALFYAFNQKLVIDSLQILERGHLFNLDVLIPFGPRSTGTNLIYGPFISFFSGIMLRIYNHPFSLSLGILLLHALSFLMLYKTKLFNFDKRFLFIYLFLFWLSPWRTSEVFIWNPSFLFFNGPLFIFGVDRLLQKNKDFWGTFFVGLSIMITLQIHNSFILFLPVILYYTLARKIYPHLGATLLSIALLVLFILPTFQLISADPGILDYNTNTEAYLFKNFVSIWGWIKGVLYWVRYPSLYFGSTTFQLPTMAMSEMNAMQLLWHITKWSFAVASILFVIKANIEFFKNTKQTELRRLCLIFLLSLVLVSAASPVSFNFWHLYLIYPVTLIPVAWFLNERLKNYLWLIPLASYFFLYTFITASSSYKHQFSSHQMEMYQKKVLKKSKVLKKKYHRFSLGL